MRILSGMRPTGKLHIGHYEGALRNWVKLQKKAGCFFMVADYHAITTLESLKTMKKDTIEMVADWLASGLDPKTCVIFQQSHVPEHTELAWILSSLTSYGDLTRMTQFKEFAEERKGQVNAGIFAYPLLMAADILLYKATHVPVGEDQKQHVELTREIAKRFNKRFGMAFVVPEVIESESGGRLKSLTDPTKKMSKHHGAASTILLSDSPASIRKKIKAAVTDSGREVKFDEKKKPAISNLLTIYSLFSGKSIKQLEAKYRGKGYAEFKNDLAEVLVKVLKPIREKRAKLLENPRSIQNILEQGSKKARWISQLTLKAVKAKMGL